MKAMIVLGLGMLSLVPVVTLCHTCSSPNHVFKGKAAPAQWTQLSSALDDRYAAPLAIRVTRQAQSVEDIRTEALVRVVELVADADLSDTLNSLVREDGPGAAELCELLVRRWAESDAPTAAAWTSQLVDSPSCRAAIEQVAIAWANSDFSAAAVWVHAMPEGGSKQSATLDLAYEAARTDPIAALELAITLLPTRERDDLLVHSVSQWSVIDFSTAAAWAMDLPDSSLRQRLVAGVAIASAEQDGAGAATLVAIALVAGDEQQRAAVSIVQRWGQSSPQDAASWVSQFPDSLSRDAALQNLLALWIDRDAGAADKWLRELPAGSLRDAGMMTYAQAMVDRN